MEKKPDGVVWDEKEKEYNAHLLPYASSLSGPLIEVPNVDAFKQKGVTQAKQQLQAQWEEMQTKMKAFAKQAQLTERIYSAKFKFEPVGSSLNDQINKRQLEYQNDGVCELCGFVDSGACTAHIAHLEVFFNHARFSRC